MNKQPMPTDANSWSKYLSDKSLPAASLAGKSLLKAIKKSDFSYIQLANYINQDPVLSFYVISEANRSKEPNAPGSKTLDHAISMIGIENLQKVVLKLSQSKHKMHDENMQSFYYSRVLTVSLYAAHLAREIAKLKKIQRLDDVYWSSLFLGTPLWYLWHFATPEMRLVRYAIRSNFKLASSAEKEVLGCTIFELSSSLAGKIVLPELAKESYEQFQQITAREWITLSKLCGKSSTIYLENNIPLKMKLASPAFAVLLGNAIANDSAHCWYSRATMRSQKILATWLGVSIDEAVSLTHRCAADMSRMYQFPGVMLPAAKIFLPPRERIKISHTDIPDLKDKHVYMPQSEPVQESRQRGGIEFNGEKISNDTQKPAPITTTAATSDSSKDPARLADRAVFDELTTIMLKTPEHFSDLHELMNAATQGIAYGLGFSRATVALVNNNKTRLKAYYTVGTRDLPELGTFQLELNKPSLFTKLIQKPSSIWVKPDSSDKIKEMIPEEFATIINCDEFFLMSIFVNNKPVAIFYADNKNSVPLSEYDYKQFKYMCTATTQCLYHMVQNRNKN